MAGEFVHREDSRGLRKMEVMGVTRENLCKSICINWIQEYGRASWTESLAPAVEES